MVENNSLITTDDVYQRLGNVLDPELMIDIVSLGLIYDVKVAYQESINEEQHLNLDQTNESQRPTVHITMTLTTPGCPLAPVIDQMVREAVGDLPGIDLEDIDIQLSFDPPWVPDMMSAEARAELGR